MTELIVALDFPTEKETLTFLDQFSQPIYVKIGMELFYGNGLNIIQEVKKRGHHIFLDLKLHDIPNTVKSAMRNLAMLDVDMVNLHAAGGRKMMEAAIEGLNEGCSGKKRPLCIAVTQLTSTSEQTMQNELLIGASLEETVLSYAKLAKDSGLDGVVCSVHEAKKIHEVCGADFLTVTPGIRLESDSKDDQVRVATPTFAKEQGSDYIVVGRPITKSENPLKSHIQIKGMLEEK